MHPRKNISLDALHDQIKALQEEAVRIERLSRPGMSQLKSLIAKHRLTKEDFQIALQDVETKRSRGVPKGTRLPPKYRNPENPQETWAGRGLKPFWLRQLMKKGRKLNEFII